MANFRFSETGVSSIAACVPREISRNEEALRGVIPDDEIGKVVEAIGIAEKRISSAGVCASDLCACAAEKIFSETKIPRDSIDVLLFMSQTVDFRIPATAPLLQTRLGLRQECACMDLSLGCSGYVYALSSAFAYANIPGVRRVLLLVGETLSKVVNPKDRVNAPLYGDAGTATIVEKSPEFGDSHFVLMTDGTGEDAVKIPAGGCRIPVTKESLVENVAEDGSVRSDCEIFMEGMDVFNFAIRSVPSAIKEVATLAGTSPVDADFVVFHQSNKMMTDFLATRLKITKNKVPYSIGKYGNTSSASIPLTIAECLHGDEPRGNMILCGFGSGFSWGAVALSLAQAKIFPVVEISEQKP